jgi:hypothetical protein
MLFFLIPVGIFLIAMLAFAFWPRTRHVVDRDELDHPGRHEHPDGSEDDGPH